MSAFQQAARDLLARHPEAEHFVFDAHKPSGPMAGDFAGQTVANLGLAGAAYLIFAAGGPSDMDLEVVLPDSGSQHEFVRWLEGLRHRFNGTQHPTAEMAALAGLEERANLALYDILDAGMEDDLPESQSATIRINRDDG